MSASLPVVIVEDDPEIRRLLRTTLEKHGYTVREAPHGEAALRHLSVDPLPGLILLDLYLPVMDGWELREAQLEIPHLEEIPVVVITAAADAFVRPEQVVKKPLDLRRLLEVVQHHCGASSPDP